MLRTTLQVAVVYVLLVIAVASVATLVGVGLRRRCRRRREHSQSTVVPSDEQPRCDFPAAVWRSAVVPPPTGSGLVVPPPPATGSVLVVPPPPATGAGHLNSGRFLVFPLYTGVGLGNQRASLQLGVLLAHLTGRQLVLDYGRNADGSLVDANRYRFLHLGTYGSATPWCITDLLSTPTPSVSCADGARLREFWVAQGGEAAAAAPPADWPTCLLDSVLVLDDDHAAFVARHPAERDSWTRFRGGRRRVLYLRDLLALSDAPVLHWRRARPPPDDPPSYSFAQPCSWVYSRHAKQRALVRQVVAGVQPTAPWWAHARAAADHLRRHQLVAHGHRADAVGLVLHWRRTDKGTAEPHCSPDEWVRFLHQAHLAPPPGAPDGGGGAANRHCWAVCTDAPDDPMLAALRRSLAANGGGRLVSIDEAVQASAPHLDQIATAWVCLLTCVVLGEQQSTETPRQQRFVGTPNSTFTAAVQTLRREAGHDADDAELRYAYPGRERRPAAPAVGRWSWEGTAPHAIGFEWVHTEDWRDTPTGDCSPR
jgi:hypothetical protein